MTRTFARSAAFSSLEELLSWSGSQSATPPTVYVGPDGSVRGSVELKDHDNQTKENTK